MAEYPGYEPQQIKLHNKAQGWVWGNVLLGGGIGLIVDCVSGASDELIPKEVHFNFVNPQFTTREASRTKEKDKKAENTQAKEDPKTISQKEYEEYQRYLAEKEKNKLQESTPEND